MLADTSRGVGTAAKPRAKPPWSGKYPEMPGLRHQIAENACLNSNRRRVGTAMGWAKPDHGRFLCKVLVTIVPAAIASGIVVYVLYAIHLTRAPESADRLTLASPLSDGLSTDERRELSRQMLKARRENPPVPGEVRPPPRPPSAGAADHAAVPPSATDAKPRPVRAAAVAPVAAPAA